MKKMTEQYDPSKVKKRGSVGFSEGKDLGEWEQTTPSTLRSVVEGTMMPDTKSESVDD